MKKPCRAELLCFYKILFLSRNLFKLNELNFPQAVVAAPPISRSQVRRTELYPGRTGLYLVSYGVQGERGSLMQIKEFHFGPRKLNDVFLFQSD